MSLLHISVALRYLRANDQGRLSIRFSVHGEVSNHERKILLQEAHMNLHFQISVAACYYGFVTFSDGGGRIKSPEDERTRELIDREKIPKLDAASAASMIGMSGAGKLTRMRFYVPIYLLQSPKWSSKDWRNLHCVPALPRSPSGFFPP
jgi:hypothetical protein